MRERELYSLEILERGMLYLFGINSMREKAEVPPRDLIVGRTSLHGKEDNILKSCAREGGGVKIKPVKWGRLHIPSYSHYGDFNMHSSINVHVDFLLKAVRSVIYMFWKARVECDSSQSLGTQ